MRLVLSWLIPILVCLAQAPPLPPASGEPAGARRPGAGRGPRDPFAGQKRVRALIVSGGCCHDYNAQNKILMDQLATVLPVDWTVIVEGMNKMDTRVALYENPNWSKGFDVVVHNECYANLGDAKFLHQIAAAHQNGVAGIVIHCSMHSYRVAEVDDWREFLGVTSRRHTQPHAIVPKIVDADSTITKALPAGYTTPVDELYVIEKLWPNAKALATAKSPEDGETYPLMWTNDYHGARVFGTTLGHGMDTWNDPVFRDVLVRAFKWAVKRE
jgi:type 1 glutamine amidotransferase